MHKQIFRSPDSKGSAASRSYSCAGVVNACHCQTRSDVLNARQDGGAGALSLLRKCHNASLVIKHGHSLNPIAGMLAGLPSR